MKKLKFKWNRLMKSCVQNRLYFLFILILILGIYLRMQHIDSPLVGQFAWREGDVAAIARNFYLNGYNILYPQVDWRGDTAGYVQSEFQLYPWIVSLFYPIFGVKIIIGKIISLLFSVGSMILMYFLVKYYLNKKAALFGMFCLAVSPLFVHMSRNLQPESLLTFLSLTSLYFFSRWLDDDKNWLFFMLSLISTALAFLVKIPSLYLGFPLLFLAVIKYRFRIFINWKLWVFLFFTLTPCYWWYYIHSISIYNQTGLSFEMFDFKMGQTPPYDFFRYPLISNVGWHTEMLTRILYSIGFLGGLLALIGFFTRQKNKNAYMFHALFLGISLFLLAAASRAYIHSYYILPMVIPLSFFAATAFDKIILLKKKAKSKALIWIFYLVILTLIIYPIISALVNTPFPYAEESYYPFIEKLTKINQIVGDNLAIYDILNPGYAYYAGLRGWRFVAGTLNAKDVEYARLHGAKYVVLIDYSDIKLLFANNTFSDYVSNASYQILLSKRPGPFVLINLTNKKRYVPPILVESNRIGYISRDHNDYKIEYLIDGSPDTSWYIAEVYETKDCNPSKRCYINFTFLEEKQITRIDLLQSYQQIDIDPDSPLSTPNVWADYNISYFSNNTFVPMVPYQIVPLSIKRISTTHYFSPPLKTSVVQIELLDPELLNVYYVGLAEVLFYDAEGTPYNSITY